jgi:hypothetical protein
MSSQQNSPRKQPSDLGKYAGMATTMAVIICGGTFGGRWLDVNYPLTEKFPVYTFTLAIFSVVAAMWYFIRDFVRKK